MEQVRTKLEQYKNLLGYQNRPEFLEKYLQTPSLLRLKKVGYFCGMDYASKAIFNFPERISRYDHSLTVSLITWKLSQDQKMTLAGLFHDIATPCFAHAIDYMNKDYVKQENTEEKTEEILRKDTYLAQCLKEDGIAIEDIINFKQYSLVDLERPKLCADRLDGIILNGLYWMQSLTMEDVARIVEDLTVYPNEQGVPEIGLATEETAKLVVKINHEFDRYCHTKEDTFMMGFLGEITKQGIYQNVITYEDLFVQNEDQVMEQLKQAPNASLQQDTQLFENITIEQVPDIAMPEIKFRNLAPICNCQRWGEKEKL